MIIEMLRIFLKEKRELSVHRKILDSNYLKKAFVVLFKESESFA